MHFNDWIDLHAAGSVGCKCCLSCDGQRISIESAKSGFSHSSVKGVYFYFSAYSKGNGIF
jgi:hypothetical protein